MSDQSSELQQHLGILRLDIDGTWTALQFGDLFALLHRTYSRLSAGYRLVESRGYFLWAYGERDRPNDETIRLLERSAEASHGPLRIGRVQFTSPGFAEVVGSLNPLKVVADTVTDWRRENTSRSQNADATRLEQRRLDQEDDRIQLERQRLANEYRLQLLDRANELPAPVRDILIARFLVEPQMELSQFATDLRLVDVDVRELPSGNRRD